MPNYNKVLLMGHLTRDPELKYSPKGSAIVTFCIAVNNTRKDDSGQQTTEAVFLDVTAFGQRGEIIKKYIKKGNPLFIEGHLHQNTWEDKQTGQRRSKLSVMLDSFQFVSGGKSDGADQDTGGGYAYYSPQPQNGRLPAFNVEAAKSPVVPVSTGIPKPRSASQSQYTVSEDDVPF